MAPLWVPVLGRRVGLLNKTEFHPNLLCHLNRHLNVENPGHAHIHYPTEDFSASKSFYLKLTKFLLSDAFSGSKFANRSVRLRVFELYTLDHDS